MAILPARLPLSMQLQLWTTYRNEVVALQQCVHFSNQGKSDVLASLFDHCLRGWQPVCTPSTSNVSKLPIHPAIVANDDARDHAYAHVASPPVAATRQSSYSRRGGKKPTTPPSHAPAPRGPWPLTRQQPRGPRCSAPRRPSSPC